LPSTDSNQAFHALIGCGRVAPTHVDAARYAQGLVLRDVVDSVPSQAEAFAQEWGLSVASLGQVMGDPGVVSVSLCTPHDTHFELTELALRSGKHVLLEKPSALVQAQVDQLAQIAAECGRQVFPITQHRFDPLAKVARDLIASGELGTVHMARVSLECVRDPGYYADSDWRGTWAREGGSVLMNQGYHFIDMLLWLLGPVQTVGAMMSNLANRDVMETEDSLVATLEFAAGALGEVNISGAAGGRWTNVIELVADRGVIAFDLSTPARVHRLELKSKKALKHWRAAVSEASAVTEMPVGVSYYGVTHRDQFKVLGDLLAGKPIDERCATLAESSQVVGVINGIYRAATSGERHSIHGPAALAPGQR
jgi:predicted dehydrogenase